MKNRIKQGVIWGLFMFVSMTFVLPLIKGSDITFREVLIGFVIWTIAWIVFGFLMRGKFKEEL